MLVTDASALTELLLGRRVAEAVAAHITDHEFDLHAPHLIDVEVLSALRRVVAAGEASADRASQAIEDLLDLPIERYPHDVLAPRIWALRENLSAYDAAYLALAEALTPSGAPLLTTDARLARGARDHSDAGVILVT